MILQVTMEYPREDNQVILIDLYHNKKTSVICRYKVISNRDNKIIEVVVKKQDIGVVNQYILNTYICNIIGMDANEELFNYLQTVNLLIYHLDFYALRETLCSE